MIRINKSEQIPASLQRSGNKYDGQDVQRQLLSDQNEKCYLCEQHVDEDFEIEHFQSRTKNPELIAKWSNLLLSCRYCNGKKSNKFDDILNPLEENIETDVEHRLIEGNRAFFTSANDDQFTQNSITLLQSIFNGRGKVKNTKEERFFASFLQKILHFLQIATQYLSDPENEKIGQAIENELDVNSEFLAFKYQIIRSNGALLAKFVDNIVWNKK